MIEDLLVTFRSAIINKNQKKAISILSTIRSSEWYTLQTINESYCTDEFEISSHMWTKAGKWYRQYGSCGDTGDEFIYEELKAYLGKSRSILVAMYERAIKKEEIEDAKRMIR